MSAGRPSERTAPPPPRRVLRRAGGVVLLAAWLLLPLPTQAVPEALAGSQRRGDGVFASLVKAWKDRSAAGVVAEMAEEGRLDLLLMSPHVEGRFQRPQAQRTLANYFKQVTDVGLDDVTPKDKDRPPRPDFLVRLYDYSYQPRGRDARITRLTITLRGDGDSGWALDSISEAARPTPGQGR